MHTMNVMNASGHTSTTWDPAEPETLEAVQKEFEDLQAQGYAAFVVEQNGHPARRTERFIPEAGEILMVPQLVGG